MMGPSVGPLEGGPTLGPIIRYKGLAFGQARK